jgi:hypothetical protein
VCCFSNFGKTQLAEMAAFQIRTFGHDFTELSSMEIIYVPVLKNIFQFSSFNSLFLIRI